MPKWKKEYNQNRKRNISFFLKLSEEEFMELEWKSNRYKKSKSELLREFINKGEVKVNKIDELPELIRQINKLGNNVNQIAKKLNSTSDIFAQDVDDTKKYMEDILDAVTKVLKLYE